MTGTEKLAVGVGGVLLALAVVVLWFGDWSLVESCESVTTFEATSPATTAAPLPSTPSGSPTSPPSNTHGPAVDQPHLVAQRRVQTCKPSQLTGGLPLILLILGGVLLTPTLLRLLPPGKYAVGFASADTTQTAAGAAALEQTEGIAAPFRAEQAAAPAAATTPPTGTASSQPPTAPADPDPAAPGDPSTDDPVGPDD